LHGISTSHFRATLQALKASMPAVVLDALSAAHLRCSTLGLPVLPTPQGHGLNHHQQQQLEDGCASLQRLAAGLQWLLVGSWPSGFLKCF